MTRRDLAVEERNELRARVRGGTTSEFSVATGDALRRFLRRGKIVCIEMTHGPRHRSDPGTARLPSDTFPGAAGSVFR